MTTSDTLLKSLAKEFGDAGYYCPEWALTNLPSKEERTIVITPELAQQLLDRTTFAVQRDLKPRLVQRYAADIQNGNWVQNEQAILRDTDGNIVDGQHRLRGCVMADKPFITKFVNGVDREKIIHTIDIGAPRSKGDSLSIALKAEVKHVKTIAGAIDYLIHFSKGTHMVAPSGPTVVTPQQIIDWVEKYPTSYGIVEDLAAIAHQHESLMSYQQFTALYYLFTRVDEKKAHKFINQLQTGIGLAQDSPILYVRNKLHMSKYGGNKMHKLRWDDKIILVIRAWNDYIQYNGKMMTTSYKTDIKTFPKIHGLNDKVPTFVE